MLPPFLAIPNTPQNPPTRIPSSRNQNRNPKPCGNCSDSKVRCNVTYPYNKLLCKRCKEDGLTKCPPYVQRNVGKRRAPYRKRNRAPDTERSDASDIVFIYENMSTSDHTEVSQAGNTSSGEIANVLEISPDVSFQAAIVQSVRKIQNTVGYGYDQAIQGGQQNHNGSAWGNIASTSAAPTNTFGGLNANALINKTSADNHSWADARNRFANETVQRQP